jgi:hypothetical protein
MESGMPLSRVHDIESIGARAKGLTDFFSEKLAEVAVELFSDHDLPIRHVSDTPAAGAAFAEAHLTGVVRYKGEGIRGALILIAEADAVRSWLSRLGLQPTDLEDTIGEFANMALGRLKARLLAEGVPLRLSTPVTSATELRFSSPPGVSTSLPFEANGHPLWVRLDAKLDSGFELKRRVLSEAPAVAGSVLMFDIES